MDDKVKELVEKGINKTIEDGIQTSNLDTLGKLVDIYKDIANIEHWKKEEENDMRYDRRYREYGREQYGRDSYGRRRRDSRGRYMEGGNYRGEEMMNDMHEAYRDYSDGREEMNMGNYGAKDDTMKSLEYMMQSVVQFIEMLEKDANSQEEIEIIKDYTRQISEM